jgi:hypothetical protein
VTEPINPRYLAFAAAHGKTPKAMLEHDREHWPGGVMCGFLLWMSAALSVCRREHPEFFVNGNIVRHDKFDVWLEEYARDEWIKQTTATTKS